MDFHRLLRVALLQDHQLSPATTAQLWPLRPRGTALAWEKVADRLEGKQPGIFSCFIFVGGQVGGVLFLVIIFQEDMYNY